MSIFFLLLVSIAAAAAQRNPSNSNITLGSSFTPNTTTSAWPSSSGLFAFGFLPQHVDSYAIGVFLSDKTVVWTANRDNDPTVPNDVVSLQLTTDGRLVLRRRQGQDVDVINPGAAIESASMLDNGNFVLYKSDSRVIWQSFDHPTNTLLPGQSLRPGGELFSSASETNYERGFFRLKMQTDGFLVQYPVNTPDTAAHAYYVVNTKTASGSNVSLNLDSDGRLYILNGSVPLMNITKGEFPPQDYLFLLRIDVGGILRIYSVSLNPVGNLKARWSPTEDPCAPNGLCGFNALCILIDTLPECQCLPGFDFVQPGNYTAGCSRSIWAQGCSKSDDIITVDNTAWYENSYQDLETVSQEECGRACLDDCNCEAAFFIDRRCKKQRLPLTYGRRSLDSSNVTLVRVNTSSGPHIETDSSHNRVKKEHRLDFLIIGIVLMVVGVMVFAISLIFAHQKQRHYNKISKDGEPNLVEDISLQVFSYKHLSEATDDFKEELGRGSSGTVFKGVMPNGHKLVAVKKLEKEFAQGEKEFQTELKTIGKTYHRNLVRLLGYCLNGDNKLLVLEYMSNGSLADILFNQDKQPSWEERVKIARDIARGILYLHQECETQIIHCDIKPENILMDENWCAKISDFGLAKLLKQDQTNTYTGIRGTRGYVAPEWYQNQAITVKADVYSFGVMFMEIICCRKCVDWSRSEDEAVLEKWVYDCYAAGKLGNIVGEEIVEERKLERIVKIGLWCVQYEPSLRPTMKKVLLMLEGTVEIPIPPSPTSFLSSI